MNLHLRAKPARVPARVSTGTIRTPNNAKLTLKCNLTRKCAALKRESALARKTSPNAAHEVVLTGAQIARVSGVGSGKNAERFESGAQSVEAQQVIPHNPHDRVAQPMQLMFAFFFAQQLVSVAIEAAVGCG